MNTGEMVLASNDAIAAGARANEVDGWPTYETAPAWVDSVDAGISLLVGGAAYHQARPHPATGIDLGRRALVAGMYLCRATLIDTGFGHYMPLNTVGLMWAHRLGELAYNSATAREEWAGWLVQTKGQYMWRLDVTAAVESIRKQWSNDNWTWKLQRIVGYAVSRLPDKDPGDIMPKPKVKVR